MVFGEILQCIIVTPFALYIIYKSNIFDIQNYIVNRFYFEKREKEEREKAERDRIENKIAEKNRIEQLRNSRNLNH